MLLLPVLEVDAVGAADQLDGVARRALVGDALGLFVVGEDAADGGGVGEDARGDDGGGGFADFEVGVLRREDLEAWEWDVWTT